MGIADRPFLKWNGNKGISLEDFIESELLVKDANSYFFSDVKHGIYDTEKAILDYYEEEYFRFFK